jgi:hypothetical protein
MDTFEVAIAAYYLKLNFYDHQKCISFRDMLVENGVADLQRSYGNITGHVPAMLCEVIASNKAMRRVDLAFVLSAIRYNHLAIQKRSVLKVQVTSLVSELAGEMGPESRRSTILQTMGCLVGEGMDERVACATAFTLHHPKREPAMRCVDIQTSDIHSHHTLPNAYLGVDSVGGLWVVDTMRGVYAIPTPTPVPHGWLCRVSNANVFVAGDDGHCVGLVLNESLDACMQTPLVLPEYPSRVDCVEHKWVVWGSRKRPHAFEWDGSSLRLCPPGEAKMYVLSKSHMDARGNSVTLDGYVVCSLPPAQTISCMFGTPRYVDVITGANDIWRIDIVKNKAWCVGMELGDVGIMTFAPLVGWD